MLSQIGVHLLFCCFAGHFVCDSVLCAANMQATQMHVRPSHVFSNEKASKRAVSNVCGAKA